jgi:hypothetical protein
MQKAGQARASRNALLVRRHAAILCWLICPTAHPVEAAMKHLPLPLPLRLSRRRLAIFAAAFGLALLAVPAAHAFTLDGNANTTPSGTPRFTDPDEQFSGTSTGGPTTTYRQGNTTFRFSGSNSPTDDRASVDRMFDPLGRPGDPR